MAWLYLVVAGLCEIAWAFGLKYSHGFTVFMPSTLTIVGILISFFLFSKAMKEIPIGTAYAVFTGIGAAGTVLIGMFFLGESASLGKIIFIIILLSGIIGLKLTSGEKQIEERSGS
jgi:quaternary ammonium compound-resistance protein SugE